MYLRLFRLRRPPSLRKLTLSTGLKNETDDLEWLRPIPIDFDETFKDFENKVKTSSDIRNDPEIAKECG